MGTDGKPARRVRVAAAGDVHANETVREAVAESIARAAAASDLVLLAGDVTSYGAPEEADVLADACRAVETPIFAVLGNHDHHSGRGDAVAHVLAAAGVEVLDRSHSHAVVELGGQRVGVAGTKGFVGGFPGSALPDFGEASLREVYAETSAEVLALERGLEAIADCELRIVLLHYSPALDTLAGEPEGIWAFLGSMRLAGPITDYRPDLVVHGHAHAGTFAGALGAVPVFNVAQPVIGRDFWLFELEPSVRDETPAAAVDARPL